MPWKKLRNGLQVAEWLTAREAAEYDAEIKRNSVIGPAIFPRFIKDRPADLVTTRRTEAQEPQSPEAPSPHDAQRTREGR